MAQCVPPASLIAGLRAERRQLFQEGILRVPDGGLQRAMDELLQDIRAGGRTDFRAILEGCLATDNPRGAAAAFIDRLIPAKPSSHEQGIERDGEVLGYYRTPPVVTLEVSNALRLTSRDTLVDVGGGSGTTAAIFALLNPEATVVCLEFQECLTQHALKLKEQFQLGNLAVVNDDAFTADLSQATALYMYYPFNDRLFSKFLERFAPQALPDFVVNGNNPELLSKKFRELTESGSSFTNKDLSWLRGNMRG